MITSGDSWQMSTSRSPKNKHQRLIRLPNQIFNYLTVAIHHWVASCRLCYFSSKDSVGCAFRSPCNEPDQWLLRIYLRKAQSMTSRDCDLNKFQEKPNSGILVGLFCMLKMVIDRNGFLNSAKRISKELSI
jgi:hypothetical protein